MSAAMKRLAPLLVLLMTTAAWACPFCKDSIPSSDAEAPGGVPSGFNTSIYFMLCVFFCMIGMVTITLVRGARGVSISRGDQRGFPLR